MNYNLILFLVSFLAHGIDNKKGDYLLGKNTSKASFVSQYSITWNFDQPYTVGQFVNGDWWALGPVTITSITPSFDGEGNGWQVNPMPNTLRQSYDTRIPYSEFDPILIPDLPYIAKPDDSIVKAISGDGRFYPTDDPATHPCYLDLVAVLTIVSEVPADNGASVFRPTYMGNSTKIYYSVNNLRTDLLPSLPPVADAPTLADIEDNFKRVQIDCTSIWAGRYFHPAQNMSQYGSSIAIDTNVAGLRLMLDDSLLDKMPSLIAYVQAGIDWYSRVQPPHNVSVIYSFCNHNYKQ